MRAAPHARPVPLLTLLLMLALALSGCTTDDGTTDPDPTDDPATGDTTGPGSGTDTGNGDDRGASSTGQVAVYLKDAPEDTFAEVHIVVTGVEVHLVSTNGDGESTPTTTTTNTTTGSTTNTTTTGSTTNTTTGTTNGTNGGTNGTNGTTTPGTTGAMAGCDGWTFVAEERLDIDLLATQGDLAAFLGTGEVPACRVTQIRLHTEEAYGITHEGDNITIQLANNELRIVRNFVVAADATTHVVIDIDLERSLREQGNQGWRLTPVIGRAYATVAPDPDAEGGQIVIAPQE